MANKVVVQWSTNESERREFGSRGEAVRFVMEELESGRRHNARMIAAGTEFNIVDIVRMYGFPAGRDRSVSLRIATGAWVVASVQRQRSSSASGLRSNRLRRDASSDRCRGCRDLLRAAELTADRPELPQLDESLEPHSAKISRWRPLIASITADQVAAIDRVKELGLDEAKLSKQLRVPSIEAIKDLDFGSAMGILDWPGQESQKKNPPK